MSDTISRTIGRHVPQWVAIPAVIAVLGVGLYRYAGQVLTGAPLIVTQVTIAATFAGAQIVVLTFITIEIVQTTRRARQLKRLRHTPRDLPDPN